jgi:choline-glycine betaine transporter
VHPVPGQEPFATQWTTLRFSFVRIFVIAGMCDKLQAYSQTLTNSAFETQKEKNNNKKKIIIISHF